MTMIEKKVAIVVMMMIEKKVAIVMMMIVGIIVVRMAETMIVLFSFSGGCEEG